MSIQESHDFDEVRDIIEEIRVAMLVTTDENKNLNSRPMYTADIDSDNNIWFFTRDDSGKVKELINNHHVNLAYTSPKSGKYLSITGTASLSDNLKRKQDLFNVMTQAWFPKGASDPDLLLIRVDPNQAEYWDTSSSKLLQLFRIVKAVATDSVYQGGEHDKVNNI